MSVTAKRGLLAGAGLFVPPPLEVFAYTASGDLRKMDADGNVIEVFSGFSNDVYGVAVDPSGFVYASAREGTIRKFDADLNQIWSTTLGGSSTRIRRVGVDPDGNVFTGTWANEVHRLDSDGNVEWTNTAPGGNVDGIAVHTSGDVISAGRDEIIRRHAFADGDVVWAYDTELGDGWGINELAVDQAGNVYGIGNAAGKVFLLDADGNLLDTWDDPPNASGRGMFVYPNGDQMWATSTQVWRTKPDGTVLWNSGPPGGNIGNATVDPNGNVWLGLTAASASGRVALLSGVDGSLLWDTGAVVGGNRSGVATTPGLPVPFGSFW